MLDMTKTFIQAYLDGEVRIGAIDVYVDFWNDGYDGGETLREFLGMTKTQYAVLLQSGNKGFEKFLKRNPEEITCEQFPTVEKDKIGEDVTKLLNIINEKDDTIHSLQEIKGVFGYEIRSYYK